MKHQNNGGCEKCLAFIKRFPGFHKQLLSWFIMLQAKHVEFHISCAGRGEEEQEKLFKKGASRAKFGESAHNYNAALDLFIFKTGTDLYDKNLFDSVIGEELPDYLEWYGKPKSKFFELPHIEVKDWKSLVKEGKLQLVHKPKVYIS